LSVRHKNLKLVVGAAGAAALTLGVAASPALAAGPGSASIAYTCGTPAGPATPTADYAIGAAPASIVAGKVVSLPTTASFTLDPATTGLATGLFQWVSFNGQLTTTPTAKRTGLDLHFPKTVLANQADGSTLATATGSTLVRAFKAGTYTLKLGNLGLVHLKGFDAQGNPIATNGEVSFPTPGSAFTACANNAGVTTVQDATPAPVTVAVTKDKSTTKTTAAYNAKKDKATGTAKVKGHFGLPGSGKVKFTLMKGTKAVKSVKAKLNKKGVASAAFKNVKAKGKYSIVAKFKGDAALKKSSGKDKFTVK
jgi:hypothetical protein